MDVAFREVPAVGTALRRRPRWSRSDTPYLLLRSLLDYSFTMEVTK